MPGVRVISPSPERAWDGGPETQWIKSEWMLTENNQRAKFYQLTAAGRKQLAEERSRWTQMSDAIAAVLSNRPEEV